jgi:tRNA uridine 5-carboxymethylaminomethyl modification enzyme
LISYYFYSFIIFYRPYFYTLIFKQRNDIEAFKKDESIVIPLDINYDSFSGLSNEIKSKLKIIKPKTLGQALRIDGVTPAAAIILLVFIKKSRYKVSA